MNRPPLRRVAPVVAALLVLAAAAGAQSGPVLGGPLPGTMPLFPATNWWNLDISAAPVDTSSTTWINYIGATDTLHPDFGGTDGTTYGIYGFPYCTVPGTQPRLTVDFSRGWPDECDGTIESPAGSGNWVSFPMYPVPAQAITQGHWVEGGDPGNVDDTGSSDRHILIVDRDRKELYELYNCWWNGVAWDCLSGAFWDLKQSNRRPEGWTSADAAGLAILPGLVRYDEAYGTGPIRHAFRFTTHGTNGHVWPASHTAGTATNAPPMGARLRLKASKDITGYLPEIQRIFQAMKTYGLILADNGSDMYISGTFDTGWHNDILNPAFSSLKTSDFEFVQRGWPPQNLWKNSQITSLDPVTPPLSSVLPLDSADLYLSGVATEAIDSATDAGRPMIFFQLTPQTVGAPELELHLKKTATGRVEVVF